MNIVVLQDRLRSGGTERQSVLLADAFAARGQDSTLLRFRPGAALQRMVCRAKLEALQPFDLGLDFFAPGLLRRLRRLKPQVVLCMGRMANCHAWRIKRSLPDIQVVCTMRTGKALPYFFRRSLRVADHVVANSEEARKTLLRARLVEPERLSVINNSLVFKPADSAGEASTLRKGHGADGGCFLLLSVAMFRPEKNQRELIEIVSGLPKDLNWQLWLAGDGPCLESCRELADLKGLRGRIRFLGWLPDPSVAYASADVAVHASTSEALSNFIIEAQAHGLPAVVYDAQGNAECMIPGRTGAIIPPGDRVEFRKALETLARESPHERALRSEQARLFARKSFDHDRQVLAYLNLFRDLAGPGPA